MKYRRILTVLVATLCCVSAFGQEIYENKWFGGAGAGMNFGTDGFDRSIREISHLGAGTALDFWVGKRFNDWFGIKAGYQNMNISKRYVEYAQYKYNYFHADAMLMRYRHFMPYAHLGYAKIDKGSVAGGVGIMAPIHLSKVLSVVPDIKATLYSDKAYNTGEKGLAANISGTLGLAVNLARPRPKKVEPVYVVPEPEPEPEPVVVPEPEPEPEPEPVIDLVQKSEEFTSRIAGITLFDFDKSFIRTEAFPVLDDIATWLIENPDHSALIEGYTDYKGSDAYNLGLSQRRADSVMKYLVDKGVAKERLEAIGRGKGKFTEGTTDAEQRQQNRRVVITLK